MIGALNMAEEHEKCGEKKHQWGILTNGKISMENVLRLKILVVGASGQLGMALMEELPHFSELFSEVVGTYCQGKDKSHGKDKKNNPPLIQLDLQNQAQVNSVILKLNPSIIINAAAMTHVDRCEEFPDLAESINAQGHFYLAEAAKKIAAKLVFISTYYVFDGTKGYYNEDDAPNPLNIYAKTKLLGEQITLKYADSLLFRTSKIYSLGYDQRNFLARLVAQFKAKEKIPMTNDQYTNPISTRDAAAAIAQLIAKGLSGVYHLGGPDNLNNYEFALAVAEKYGFDAELLQPRTTEQFAAPALRPKRCALDVHKLIKQVGFEPHSIDTNLTLWKNQI